MRWDTTAQGFGFILLSTGLTFALYFLFFFQIEDQWWKESKCEITEIDFLKIRDDVSSEFDKHFEIRVSLMF